MEVSKALKLRRTIRKFTPEPIPKDTLVEIIEYARIAAYPANLQPLKYVIASDKTLCDKIFPHTKWAGYLPDGTPKETERPTAYILVFGDTSIKNTFEVEAGAAVTSMMLGAFDKGIGSCWIGSIDKEKILECLDIDANNLSLLYVLALGYPAQNSQICKMDDSVKYFLDKNGTLNVPKRSIDEVLIDIR